MRSPTGSLTRLELVDHHRVDDVLDYLMSVGFEVIPCRTQSTPTATIRPIGAGRTELSGKHQETDWGWVSSEAAHEKRTKTRW